MMRFGRESRGYLLFGTFLFVVLEVLLVVAILWWPSFEKNIGPDSERVHYRRVTMELDEIKAAKGRRVLILSATRDGHILTLDLIGELGDFVVGKRSI